MSNSVLEPHLLNLHRHLSDLIHSAAQLHTLSQYNLTHLNKVPYTQFIKALDHLALKLVSLLNCFLPVLDLFKNNIVVPFDTLGAFDPLQLQYVPEWISAWYHPHYLQESSELVDRSKALLVNRTTTLPTAPKPALSKPMGLGSLGHNSHQHMSLNAPLDSKPDATGVDEALILDRIKAHIAFHDQIINSVESYLRAVAADPPRSTVQIAVEVPNFGTSTNSVVSSTYSTGDAKLGSAAAVEAHVARTLVHSGLKFMTQPYSK